MSRYHRATHRANESYPNIVNHGSGTREMGSNLTEIERGTNSTEKALEKTSVSKDQFKRNQELPKKVVHVNLRKADPETQGIIKNSARKTGKDSYTYEKGKEPVKKKWGSDQEVAKAHAIPSKGTVGVLGRNGQDYDVYSPGNPGYLGSPGHKTPTKKKNGNSRRKGKRN